MTISVSAHPGNTDDSGKHSCWTNCAKWGLEYGEYHGHDGDSTSSSSSDYTTSNSDESYDTYDDSPYIYETEGDDLEAEGYSRGYTAGESGAVYDEYDYYLHRGNSPAAYERYLLGYELGYKEGKVALEEKIKAQKIADEEGGRKAGEKKAADDYFKKINQPLENKEKSLEWNKGFREAYEDVQSELEEIAGIAFEDGYALSKIKTSYNKYEASIYEAGYEAGFEERRKEVFDEGYNDAYKLDTYSMKINDLDERLQTEYRKGFDSNSKVEKIRKKGIKDGQSILPTNIPAEYQEAELMIQAYEAAFQEGRKDLYKIIAISTISVCTVLICSLIVFKRRRKVTKQPLIDKVK